MAKFSYTTSTVQQIAEHFNSSTRQTVFAIRKHYKDDEDMTSKLDDAFKLARKMKLQEQINSL